MIKIHARKFRALPLLFLGAMMLVAIVPRNTYATTSLQSTDFSAQSFSKTVDYYDYVRQYAAAQGYNITSIQNQHAYIYANYVNVDNPMPSGLGLVDYSLGDFVEQCLDTIPLLLTILGEDSCLCATALNASTVGGFPLSPV
jgi:hypothetical protein